MAPPMTRRAFLGALAATAGLAIAGRPGRLVRAAAAPLRVGFIEPAAPAGSPAADLLRPVAEAARQGATMAGDEFRDIAAMLGQSFELLSAPAADPRTAVRVAQEMMDKEGLIGFFGGFDEATCRALSRLAEERQVPFLNIGCTADSLRGEACARYTFHVEASAAMYLDALADWLVREGFRRWYLVAADSPEGNAQLERARRAVLKRHWGGREVGNTLVPPGAPDFGDALSQIGRARPDVVLLLLDPGAQLTFLAAYDKAGLTPLVTGFPYPAAQTRAFYSASRKAAPRAGAGFRAALWEARIDAYGGRELNARFLKRFGRPMDPPAWAAWQAVKILRETTFYSGSTKGPDLVAYLEDPNTIFDVYKGIGVSFRPWDHQLRQTLFLVKIKEDTPRDALDVADLVGQLPAIYLTGETPEAMLDQIGDGPRDSRCRLSSMRGR